MAKVNDQRHSCYTCLSVLENDKRYSYSSLFLKLNSRTFYLYWHFLQQYCISAIMIFSAAFLLMTWSPKKLFFTLNLSNNELTLSKNDHHMALMIVLVASIQPYFTSIFHDSMALLQIVTTYWCFKYGIVYLNTELLYIFLIYHATTITIKLLKWMKYRHD